MPNRSPKPTLQVELLEDRTVPTTYGLPWPDAAHLTMSFAPDGTAVGDRTSNLYQAMNAVSAPNLWKPEILRAYQTWASKANINISYQTDGGQPFGTTGPQQGDDRFGDIRVAGYPMGKDVVALSSPFEPDAGTWAGDVKFNTAYSFGVGGQGQYDVFKVALHEAGHAFGLDDNTDPTSVMDEDYHNLSEPSANDLAQFLALYGARKPDSYEGTGGNDSFAAARPLLLPNSLTNTVGMKLDADITTLRDSDFYSFNTGLAVGGISIKLNTAGVSLLAPRVSLYDSRGKLVQTAASTTALNGSLVLKLSNPQLLSTYYVKVESGSSDVFGIGAYQLKVNLFPVGVPIDPDTLVGEATGLLNDDHHTDDTFLTALNLQQLIQQADARYDFATRGSISDSWDVDYYRIKAPQTANGAATVLTATVWGLENGALDPRVTVYDAYQRPVSANVLVSEAQTDTIQIPSATPGATYYVKVAAATPTGANNTGNYFLGVDFGTVANQQQTFADDTLSQLNPQDFYTLTTDRPQLQHLVVSTTSDMPAVQSAMRMTIYDSNNSVVFSMVVAAGDTRSASVFLAKGTYTVRLAAATRDRTMTLPPLHYRINGSILDDPVGPRPSDTSGSAAGSGSGSGSGGTTWTGSNTTMAQTDPYSDPYSNI